MATASDARTLDGVLPIDSPLAVPQPDGFRWDDQCDVLVVGFGAAGGAAALSAQAEGADVRIVERFDGGGATIKSGGVVYLGGGTRYQREAGYEDTPEAMFQYLRQECGDAVSEPTLRAFCDGSLELLSWLEGLGVEFSSHPAPPKTSYPPNGTYLYYSGSESAPAFAEHAKPAPRGHRVKAPGIDSGRVLYAVLRQQVEQRGIPVLRQTSARRLINVAPGKADRLRAEARALELAEAKPLRVRARRGVVLSTGGFIFNRDMVREHAPNYLPAMRLGATGCDGSGIRLGQSVGAAVHRMEKGSAWRFINPPTAWPRGVVVGPQGERFCNEQVYGARLGVAMVDQQGGKAWLVLDRALRWKAIREALSGRLWFFQSVPAFFLMLLAPRARSLAALAQKIGLPPQALELTVSRYTADIHNGVEDAQRKSDDMRAPLDTPPYYALNISADSRSFPCPTITLGGLRVSEADGAVLNGAGQAIDGLYAAGRAAVGVASNGYVSGLSLADCLFSGRRAGRCAAATESQSNAA